MEKRPLITLFFLNFHLIFSYYTYSNYSNPRLFFFVTTVILYYSNPPHPTTLFVSNDLIFSDYRNLKKKNKNSDPFFMISIFPICHVPTVILLPFSPMLQ